MDWRIRLDVLAILWLLIVARPAAAAEPALALKSVAYDVSFILDARHPDDKPNPPAPPLKPDDPIGPQPPLSRSEAKEHLIKLVRETIDPTSWDGKRVPGTSIAFEGDKLVIVQTAENHAG